MNVLVDTSVWSLALRRKPKDRSAGEARLVSELEDLILGGRVAIIGPIRQELLSGIRTTEQFHRLRDYLLQFSDEVLHTADFIAAAELSNLCLAKGLTVAAVDSLIAAVTMSRRWSVFSTDADFESIARHTSLRVHPH